MAGPPRTAAEDAIAYLRGAVDLEIEEVLQLAATLEEQRRLRHAWKVLERARSGVPVVSPFHRVLAQEQVSCMYRDLRLPQQQRLELARRILIDCDDPTHSTDQRTLGLAGSIEKRFWKLNGHPQHLHRALAYYLRGARLGIAEDRGYTAINAAYTLDLLALLERRQAKGTGLEVVSARDRTAKAEALRGEIIGVLGPILDEVDGRGRWWVMATLAEAYFGIGEYDRAREWVERALEVSGVQEWQRETTATQLAALAMLRNEAEGLAGEWSAGVSAVLDALVGDHRACFEAARVGKVGLALSGGGFRASLFHLGVLARLAEADVLRYVEVISCVSGGSIVGAHYYLELKRLLETVPDAALTREHYVEIVRRVIRDFLAGVQRNVRMRVLAELTTNVKMIFLPHYSRTLRVGELYEREIYARVADGGGHRPRYLDELTIRPAGEDVEWRAETGNWRRRAKVPALVINATTLNTGHNWQFTTEWMGEPPVDIDEDVDGNERLRRISYGDAPEGYRRFRLGHAVAASSCVPGLFEPLELARLYDDRVIRLVDGGVHDNQGISPLLEGDCTTLLVSDASGQMVTERNPEGGLLSVLLRSNDILMARVRQEQHQELQARRRSGLVRGVFFVHLKRGLGVEPVDWVDCPDPYPRHQVDGAEEEDAAATLPYGIPVSVQRCLAGIRTDLDSFCDAEAHALMLSGYRVAEHDLATALPYLGTGEGDAREAWEFLAAEPAVREAALAPSTPMAKVLRVASSRAFKVWKLIPLLSALPVLAVGILLGVGAWLALGLEEGVVFPLEPVLYTVGVVGAVIGALFLLRFVPFVAPYRKAVSSVLIGTAMALGGFLAARVQLHFFDPLYLAFGSAERLYPSAEGRPPRPRSWFAFAGLRREPAGSSRAVSAAAELSEG